MRLLAVCTGTAQPIAAKSGLTGHFKVPRASPVTVNASGLAGWWAIQSSISPITAARIRRSIFSAKRTGSGGPTHFGENLLVGGLAGGDLALGDIRRQVGAAQAPGERPE